jgi:hypothetical protein
MQQVRYADMQVQCMIMQEGSKHAKQSRNGLFMKSKRTSAGPAICITSIMHFEKKTMGELRNVGSGP